MSNIEYEEVFPEASRIMEGLRETGYEFNTAIADIVDNSIAAEATKVIITVQMLLSGDFHVSIADNGTGMSRSELLQAMRYGAPERKNKHSLGKFGLGLKTSSTSCCRRLKVVSRDAEGDINCAVWDLDYIAKSGKWHLLIEKPNDTDMKELDACTSGGHGTLVVWGNCDKLLSARFSNPSTKAYREGFERAKAELRQHLAMVYQRFLDPNDQRAANVEILLNDEKVVAWDPFCKELDEEYETDLGSEEFHVFDSEGTALGVVEVIAHIAPPSQALPDDEARRRVMPNYKNKQLNRFSQDSLSGFYIYRENRLILWGEWFNMAYDFHRRLCRYELSFGAELDDILQVDIKKSRIILNPGLRDDIAAFAQPFAIEGEKRYRREETKASKKKSKGLHEEANQVIAQAESSLVNQNSVVAVSPNSVQISNRFGITVVPYNVVENDKDITDSIEVVSSLQEGELWAPALINKKRGVQLNASHEFYKRFYGANQNNQAALQAMDYVFYALAQAETEALAEEAKENLSESRYETSHLLRKLSKFMPDVSLEDIEGSEA